ncbi:hypothetical protein [Yaniella flava]
MHDPTDARTYPDGAAPPLSANTQRVAAINRGTWVLWLWVVWLLPIIVITTKAALPGGAERLFLMLSAVIVIPLAGVLGWLPRCILKKRGFRHSPSAVTAVFSVHWVAFSLSVLAIGGATQQGPVPSPLSQVLPFVGDTASTNVVMISSLLVGVSYAAMVLLVAFLPRPHYPGPVGGTG